MKIGEKIDKLYGLRQEKAELQKQIRELEALEEPLEQEVLEYLLDQGMSNMATSSATAVLSSSIVPNVEDWDAFHRFVIETKQPYLLQRRVSVEGCRDLWHAGETINGVSPFTKTTLLLRKKK